MNPHVLAAVILGLVVPSPLQMLADAREQRRSEIAGRNTPWARVFWSDGKGMAEGWFVSTERSKYPRRLYLMNATANTSTADLVRAVQVAYGSSYGYENVKVYRLG